MADTENTSTEKTDAEGAKTEAPWGADFDAERAWKLIQNLRTERDAIKTERDTLKSERQAREDEGKTELQKLQDRLDAAEKAAKDSARELALQKVLRKHPELEDFTDLLSGDTEEELLAKAERLAAIGAKKGDEGEKPPAADGEDGDDIPGKPKPSLTPGHGGGSAEEFDPVAIAKAARNR
ncbi:scaffolding protein [Arthrobacter phage Snek]|uniref:Scaffolding protein n=1 Tax=Arthrobacter phage Tweety19 TaxID=2768133 RepID=A0A7G9W204_9CAUD|nr:head scaffolding protein [Arthrobacter phage Tweety19]QNO12667.1 scaffolding protein [Arthrobacter phage Tweety19]